MSAEVIRVLAVVWPGVEVTSVTPQRCLTPPRHTAAACTARSTVYASAVAAGLMLQQFTGRLRGQPKGRRRAIEELPIEERLTSRGPHRKVQRGRGGGTSDSFAV
jgi:hypothetical protein